MKTKLVAFFSMLCFSFTAYGASPSAYEFNVYTSGNIGSSGSGYGSNITGIMGSGGSAYFNGFSGHSGSQPSLYSVYTNNNFSITSGSINNGGVEAGGNINVSGSAVYGNLHGGGNLTGSSGGVSGNVSLQGSNNSSVTIGGTVSTGQAFTPSVNYSATTSYFQNASNYWSNLAPTASYNNYYGQLQVSGLQSGRNIVNLAYSALQSACGISLNGPADAFVIFNITGIPTSGSQALKSVSFSFGGGMNSSNVLYNITNGASLLLNGGYLSILGINSDMTFGSGNLTGNLIAQNLYGAGGVQTGSFTGFALDQHNFNVAAPEPATYAVLGSILAVMFFAKRRGLLAQKE